MYDGKLQSQMSEVTTMKPTDLLLVGTVVSFDFVTPPSTTANGIQAQYETEHLTYYYYDDDHHHDDDDNDATKATTTKDSRDDGTTGWHPMVVSVYYATTTRGGNIVEADRYDDTGIMIWPATHLLCQCMLFVISSSSSNNSISQNHECIRFTEQQQLHNRDLSSLLTIHSTLSDSDLFATKNVLVSFFTSKDLSIKSISSSPSPISHEEPTTTNPVVVTATTNHIASSSTANTTTTILELGCGCGILGVVIVKAIMMASQQTNHHRRYFYMSTDMNLTALELCHYNYQLNGIPITSSYNHRGDHSMTTMLSSSSSSPLIDHHRNNSHDNNSVDVMIRTLQWDDTIHIQQVQDDLRRWYHTASAIRHGTTSTTTTSHHDHHPPPPPEQNDDQQRFDMIIGADIVYPSTCYEVLDQLFHTVDILLKQKRTKTTTTTTSTMMEENDDDHDENHRDDNPIIDDDRGIFVLSFCSRDGYKTPIRLLQAATNASYAMISSMKLSSSFLLATLSKLPPLLDSIILIFQKHDKASDINGRIGISEYCPIFPNLYQKKRDHDLMIQQQQQQQRSNHDNDDDHEEEVVIRRCFDELPMMDDSDDDVGNDHDDDT